MLCVAREPSRLIGSMKIYMHICIIRNMAFFRVSALGNYFFNSYSNHYIEGNVNFGVSTNGFPLAVVNVMPRIADTIVATISIA